MHQDYKEIYYEKNLDTSQDKNKEYIKQHYHNQDNYIKSKPILNLKNKKYEALDHDITEGEVKSLAYIFKTMSELNSLLLANNNLNDKKLALLLDAIRQNPNRDELRSLIVS